jgi:hypothetical protein
VSILDDRIQDYVAARAALRQVVKNRFPDGTIVLVKQSGNQGFVSGMSDDPAMIRVLHENGSIWDVHATRVQTVEGKNWHPWIIRRFQQFLKVAASK